MSKVKQKNEQKLREYIERIKLNGNTKPTKQGDNNICKQPQTA